MKKFLLALLLFPFLAYAQSGAITINLKSGDQIKTNYAYLNNNTGFSRSYVRINDKRGEKISIDRVKFIEGKDQHGTYKFFQPINLHGSKIWAERSYTSDRVNLYYTNIISGTWSASYKSKYFQYSKDQQYLKTLTYSNLKMDFGDHAESMEHLKKANALRITQGVFYGLGAALVGIGISRGLRNTELRDPNDTSIKIPPAFIAGAISLYIPWFMNDAKQTHFVNALKNYK